MITTPGTEQNFQYPCHRLHLLITLPQYKEIEFYNLFPLPLKLWLAVLNKLK